MSGLNFLKQLLLPGVKTAKGAERVAGKPGYYTIDPSVANSETRAILKRAERRAMEEGDLAERPNGGPISMKGRENARGAHMLSGALNELRYAADAGGSIARPVKGLVYVDKSGTPRAAAAINREKAGEYLSDDFDLDFTKASPNYLEYVSTTTPDVRGSDLLRTVQELYGDDMVFQVANPKKNVSIYEAMGAQRMAPRLDGGDVLGGDEGLPAFRIEKRIPERGPKVVDLEAEGQLRLPGFKKGGWPRPLSEGRGRKDTSRSVFDEPDTIYPPTASEMGETLLNEAAFNMLPIGALAKLGKRIAKGAARSAPVAVPAVAAASSDDAEAGGGLFRYFADAVATPSVWQRLAQRTRLEPEQLDALRAYVTNPAPFQPNRVRNQRAAIENAVATRALTKQQAENIDNTRQALEDALAQRLVLPGGLYRGLTDFYQSAKRGDIIGGYHPASFGYDPDLVRYNFLRHPQNDMYGEGAAGNTLIKIPKGSEVGGVVVPRALFSGAGDESEVLLSPYTRLLVREVTPTEEARVIVGRPTLDVDGPMHDVSAWKRGGLAQAQGAKHGA